MSTETLTLELDGITAGDYLQWIHDPEPPALDHTLLSISIDANPLGDVIVATVDWDGPLPQAQTSAAVAGLPLTHGARLGPAPGRRR